MKKILIALLCGMLLMLTACGSGNQKSNAKEENKTVKIGIIQLIEHPSLDSAREGFIVALKDAGYEEGKNLKIGYQNAQGDMNNNMAIAQKLVSDKKDLVLAITTESAQSVAQANKDIPILFTAITDQVGADLVKSIEQPGGNVTGTSDTHPEAIKVQ